MYKNLIIVLIIIKLNILCPLPIFRQSLNSVINFHQHFLPESCPSLPLTIVCAPSVCWLFPYLSAFLRQSNRTLGAQTLGQPCLASDPGFAFTDSAPLDSSLAGTVRISSVCVAGLFAHILRSLRCKTLNTMSYCDGGG